MSDLIEQLPPGEHLVMDSEFAALPVSALRELRDKAAAYDALHQLGRVIIAHVPTNKNNSGWRWQIGPPLTALPVLVEESSGETLIEALAAMPEPGLW